MKFVRARVTSTAPLRVQLDGDEVPLPITPESLVDPRALLIGDYVRCEFTGHGPIVYGRVGGDFDPSVQAALATRMSAAEAGLTRAPKGVIPSSVVVGSGSASVALDGAVTFAGVSSVSLNGVFDGLGGDTYMAYFWCSSSTDQANILGRFRAAGVDLASASYGATYSGSLNGAAWVGQAATNTISYGYFGYGRAPGSLNAPSMSQVMIARPRSTSTAKSMLATLYAPNYIQGVMGSYANSLASFDGFTVLPAAGTMTGTLKVVKVA